MKHPFLSILFAFFAGTTAIFGQDLTATVTHQSAPNVNDGAIDLTENGGFPPYEYAWKGPNGFTATTQDISSLAPGQYCVTVTDALCGTAAMCRIVCRCDPIIVHGTAVGCPYNSNGIFTLLLSGQGSFNLQWSDGVNQTLPSSGAVTWTQRTGLDLGVYCVTVTNAAGCSESVCGSVSSSVQPIQVNGNLQQPNCNTLSGGAITLVVTGGASPYTYLWSDNSQAKDRTNLNPGQYCVTVTDRKGCTETECFNIVAGAPSVKIAVADITMPEICTEAPPCEGAVNIEILDGTAPYSYSWVRQGGGFTSSQQDISNLCLTGNYSVTVTDVQGCTAQKTVKICCCGNYGEPGQPTLPGECDFGIGYQINLNGQATPAFGTQGGSINISFNEGTQGYSLVWKKDGQFFSYNKNITNLQPGQYCVTVKKGCYQEFKCFNIVNCDDTNITVSGTTNPTCQDYEAGKISITLGGNGAGPFKYKWSNGSINQNLEDLTAGTYTVTVTDNNGCTGTSSFTINTTQINIINQGCTQITMCGSEVVKVQQFDVNWQFESDCRYARVVCANGYVGPLEYLGATEEYPAGPTGCIIRLRCLNGQIYDQYTGQTLTELVGGIDNCGLPYCAYLSYCYYQELGGYDENSVRFVSNGYISNIQGDFLGQSCPSGPGCNTPWSPCCENKYYCEGGYIGEGYGPCGASALNDSVPDIDILRRIIKQQHPEYKTLGEILKGATEYTQQTTKPHELVSKEPEPKLFHVSPNPFFDKLNIEMFSEKEKEVNFVLTDINGKTMLQQTFHILEGSNQLIIDVEAQLPAGSYFLLMTDETGGTDARLLIKAN